MTRRCRFATAVLIVLVTVNGCKKDDEAPTQPGGGSTNTTSCNFSTDVVAVSGSNHSIVKYNCSGSGLSEFLIDSGATTASGVVLSFEAGTGIPAAGSYLITADAAHVNTGQVYVEFYDASTAWHGTTDTVHVAEGGAGRIYTFCSLTLTAGGTNTKTVSLRATCP